MKSHISRRSYHNFLRRRAEIPSIGDRLNRFIDDLSKGKGIPRVSKTFVSVVIIVFAAFIAGGGIYDLLDDPPSIFPGPGGTWLAVHPYMGEQTINESIVSMVLTLFMVGGLIVSYRSTRVTNDSKKANSMLAIGIALVLLGLAGSQYLMVLKRTIGR